MRFGFASARSTDAASDTGEEPVVVLDPDDSFSGSPPRTCGPKSQVAPPQKCPRPERVSVTGGGVKLATDIPSETQLEVHAVLQHEGMLSQT
jgi:hypothetical protein